MATIAEAMALGQQYQQAGDLDQAEHIYRQILQTDPSQAETWRLLGGVYQARNHLDDAASSYREALRLRPNFAEAHNDLGVALALAGRMDEAADRFGEALRLAPHFAEARGNLTEAHFFLGQALRKQGRAQEAIPHFRRALELKPAYADVHNELGIALAMAGQRDEAAAQFREAQRLKPGSADPPSNLGIVLAMLGRLDEAIASFHQALRVKPDYAEAHYNLGTALRNQGRFAEAVDSLQQALRFKPDYAEAHANLGLALWHLGRVDEAVTHYTQALRLKPDYAEAHNNLGLALRELGRAADAVACYRQALRLKPNSAEMLTNLGNALKDQAQFDEAASCYQQALRIQPNYADAHNSLGNALLEQGRHDEAEASYRNALHLRPDYAEAHNNLGNAFADQGKLDDALASYREALRLKPTYASAHSNLLLHLNYQPGADPDLVFADHRRWESLHGQPQIARPTHTNRRDPERRLRVGYVTPDLNRHPVARFFVEPILAHHDPARVETICYAEVPSAMAARVQALAGGWRGIRGKSDAQVAEQVRRDGIDILVDLAGHTVNSRLGIFTYKPAPIQVTGLGYPNTTGLSTMDYRLTDAIADPPGEPVRHTEELVRLPHGFCCYAPQEGVPEVSPLPAGKADYVTFGSPHHLAKLNAGVIDLWCTILRALPTARLLVFRHTLKGRTKETLHRRFVERRIAAERIEMRQATDMLQGYLGFYGAVEVTLDAFPWSSHTTACDSLWMGVPLVTLAGHNHAGRMAASVLSRVGLSDLAADTPEKYLATAVALANDRERLTRLRSQLRQTLRTSPLGDGSVYTRDLEDAYRTMWRRWCG
jgi:predicted O-linked N-acetylglucosamine transferase (SPINDLY family)